VAQHCAAILVQFTTHQHISGRVTVVQIISANNNCLHSSQDGKAGIIFSDVYVVVSVRKSTEKLLNRN